MDVDWQSQWGNYIVTHRTPENWKEYGRETGELLALNEWDEFLFYRIANDLSLTEKSVDEKADHLAREMVDDFRMFGIEMHRDYTGQNHGTPAERKLWVTAFTKAYSETLDGLVASMIPQKLVKNLDRFCNLLSWMRMGMDHGSGRGEEYGIRLSGKKAEPEKPERQKYKPTRKELHDLAVKSAKRKIESARKSFMARKTDGSDFRTSMLHYGVSFRDSEWQVSDLERDYFNEVLVETFQDELGKKALELAPQSAWENSYLICTIYDRMLELNPPKKKDEASGSHKGFWARTQRESYETQRERRIWQEAEREKIRKQLEKEAAKAAKK